MFENKEIKIVLSEEANEEYDSLNEIVGEELKKGIESSFHQTLLRSINRARDLLKKNPFAGDQIQKKLIPEKYKKLYDVENLWRIELANRWRLIYTITGDKIEIINFVVDIFDHTLSGHENLQAGKNYDKVFGYKN